MLASERQEGWLLGMEWCLMGDDGLWELYAVFGRMKQKVLEIRGEEIDGET